MHTYNTMGRPVQHYFQTDFGGAAAPPRLDHVDGNDSEAIHSESSDGSDATCCSSKSFIDNEAFRDDATSASPPSNVLNSGRQPTTTSPLPESGHGPACDNQVVAHQTPMTCTAEINPTIGRTPLPPLDTATVRMIHMDVEACLRQGMTKEETCRTLTQCRGYHILAIWLVWAGLEKQNPDFFQLYKPGFHTNFGLY